MKDFALKLFSLFVGVGMLLPIYLEIETQTLLEIIGVLAIMFFPFRYIARMNYKHWKEL